MATYTNNPANSNGIASALGSGTLIGIEGNTFLHLFDISSLIDGTGDLFNLGSGNDSVIAGDGNDTINGGGGNDTINGRFGLDVMDGGSGIDTHDVTFFGGAYVWNMATGLTNFIGETAVNFENALLGSGNDSITGNGSGNNINGGAGNDTILSGGGFDTITGGAGNDSMQGGFTADTVNGNDGNDTLTVLDGEFVDVFDGGAGTDNLDLSDFDTEASTVDLTAGTYSVSGLNSSTIANVENVKGGGGADELTGNSSANNLLGLGGNDTLDGVSGNDTLDGGNGDDRLFGGSGSDSITGGSGNDLMQGGFNEDTVNGNDGNDTLAVLDGEFVDIFDGGAGTDNLDLSGFDTEASTVDLTAGTYSVAGLNSSTISNVENVKGGGGADELTGNSSANNLLGLDGNDTLEGAGGNDTLNGANGDDTLLGGSGEDTITGGAGNDLIQGGFSTDSIDAGSGNDRVVVLEGEFIDNVDGGADTDTLNLSAITSKGADINLNTGSWDLSPTFGGPATISNVENVIGTQSNDTVIGNAGANIIKGGAGNDIINGGAGNDRLTGGGGLDTLTGGLGRDIMTGKAGADDFDFNAVAQSGTTAGTRDKITDFAAGTNVTTVDQIDLSTIDANSLVAGNQAFVFGGAFTAGHVRAVQSGANTLIRINTDADASAEMVIQLNNVLVGNIDAGDFIL